MIEEPYRWLEAIANRREYIREQIKQGTPVLAVSLADGVLLLGVGSGDSKVFEVFDRHGIAGLGHPADLEKLRQAAIDAAHMEAFHRAPEDVSLRRLVSFGLSAMLKTAFEQVFSAPYMVEALLVELGKTEEMDIMMRLRYDGGYEMKTHGVAVAAQDGEMEAAAEKWILKRLDRRKGRKGAAEVLLEAWAILVERRSFDEAPPDSDELQKSWKALTVDKVIEAGWLDRKTSRRAAYEKLTAQALGL